MTTAARCSICQSEEAKPFCVARDYNRGIDDSVFYYEQCSKCATLELRNAPEDIARYYSDEYFLLPESPEQLLPGSKVDRAKIQLLKTYADPGIVLEIGPGVGGFAYLAKKAGYTPQVIEIDPRCRQFIGETLGISASAGPENLQSIADESVDVVVLWHVFEHLPDAPGLLAGLPRVLRPGGTALIALPNPQSLQFKLFGRFWAHLDAPRHRLFPPAAALSQAAEARGLEVVDCLFNDAATLYWNRFGWIYSAENLASSATMRKLLRLLGLGAAAISYALGRMDPTKSAYTLILRKN